MLFDTQIENSLSRKEKERIYKQNEILKAALKLFAENGYENTTMDHIAVAAEYGKGTIYNYFQSKEEIYQSIIVEIFTEYYRAVEEINNNSKTLKDFFTTLTEELFEFCINNKYTFLLLIRARAQDISSNVIMNSDIIKSKHDMITSIVHNRIKSAIENKEIRSLNPKSLFTLYRSMIFPYIYNRSYCEGEKINIEDDVNLITSVLFNGILRKN